MQNKSQCSSDKLSAKQPINASPAHTFCLFPLTRGVRFATREGHRAPPRSSLLFLIKTPASAVRFPQKGCGERRQL
jgi:hypothetical protein